MAEFKVTEMQKTNKTKPGESSTTYKAVLVEDVGEEKIGNKLVLTSEKPIDLTIGDEMRLEKVAFQKKLRA